MARIIITAVAVLTGVTYRKRLKRRTYRETEIDKQTEERVSARRKHYCLWTVVVRKKKKQQW